MIQRNTKPVVLGANLLLIALRRAKRYIREWVHTLPQEQ